MTEAGVQGARVQSLKKKPAPPKMRALRANQTSSFCIDGSVRAKDYNKALALGINEFPARVVSGIKPAMNRLGSSRRPFIKMDDRFVRDV
jgi:hypothetical protein